MNTVTLNVRVHVIYKVNQAEYVIRRVNPSGLFGIRSGMVIAPAVCVPNARFSLYTILLLPILYSV